MSGTEETIARVLLAAYIVEVLIAVFWAYPGILRYWREEHGYASRLWSAIVVMKGIAILGAILTLPFAAAALFDLPRLPGTGIVIMAIVMFQVATVIVYRLVFDDVRRRGRRITEPDPPGPDEEGGQ